MGDSKRCEGAVDNSDPSSFGHFGILALPSQLHCAEEARSVGTSPLTNHRKRDDLHLEWEKVARRNA